MRHPAERRGHAARSTASTTSPRNEFAVGAEGAASRKRLSEVVGHLFQQAFDDWSEMVGYQASVRSAQVRLLRSSIRTLERMVDGGVLARTLTEGRRSGPILFILPRQIMGGAVAAAMMMPPGPDPTVDGANEDHVEAAMELMNLFCGSTTRALEAAGVGKISVSRSAENLLVHVAPKAPSRLPEGQAILCVRVNVECGEWKGRAWCLLPEPAASQLVA